jgi:thiol-disulfide isomerase/thioredoxin
MKHAAHYYKRMKLMNQLFLIILLAGLSGCKHPEGKIVINGVITGKNPEKIEYTFPIHGVCNWYFTQSVQADSLGKFQISIVSGKPIFVKMKISGNIQGTLIAEPGKTYEIRFDPDNKANNFSVAGPGSVLQEAFNKLPHPEHIQIGAREFLRDSVAGKIKETIEQRRKAEIAVFEKLLSEKVISSKVLDLVQTDRNCYYDAVLATTAWIKNLMTIQGRGNHFTPEFENLWKDTFTHLLFSNPELVNSPWFNFYAESYIYYREFITGNFTKEKMEALRESKLTKTYRVNKAKEYLPVEVLEDYLANYLYEESIQKQYEKELISLFDDFKAYYPESRYIPYISPFIDEIIEFHKTAESGFSEKTKFVENYQHLNSLTEIANTFPIGRIYVDVWATWCGPCKAEFEYREELKKLLQKNNIQILYISVDREEDSIQWKNMIKFYNLEGYHVQANKELEAELRKIFDRNGSIAIPWYILMDNLGNIIRKHAIQPSRINDLEKEIQEK